MFEVIAKLTCKVGLAGRQARQISDVKRVSGFGFPFLGPELFKMLHSRICYGAVK